LSVDEFRALESLLLRLREIQDEMKELNGGVALLHTEAAVAALESRLRKIRVGAE